MKQREKPHKYIKPSENKVQPGGLKSCCKNSIFKTLQKDGELEAKQVSMGREFQSQKAHHQEGPVLCSHQPSLLCRWHPEKAPIVRGMQKFVKQDSPSDSLGLGLYKS